MGGGGICLQQQPSLGVSQIAHYNQGLAGPAMAPAGKMLCFPDFHQWPKEIQPQYLLCRHQFSSVAQSCPTLCNPMNCSMPRLPVHHQLPEFTQTHIHRVGDAIQPSHPLSSLFLLPSVPLSIRVFSNESILRMRWPKYWSFNFSIIPSKEIPGLISFRMDWLDLLAVQGTLKSLLQHHSSKASILQH